MQVIPCGAVIKVPVMSTTFSALSAGNRALTIETTHGAVRSALAERKQHGESVADRIVELKNVSTEIHGVISQFETV